MSRLLKTTCSRSGKVKLIDMEADERLTTESAEALCSFSFYDRLLHHPTHWAASHHSSAGTRSTSDSSSSVDLERFDV